MFVSRNGGVIFGAWTVRQSANQEELPDDHPDLLAFLASLQPSAAELARRDAIDAAIAGDATIASLKAMTPAEFDTWWAANVTTASQAITVLKRIARVVLRRLC